MDNFKQDDLRRIEAEKEAWSNKFVADATNNNLDHVVTLKYMNLLLYIDIHLQSVKYIINEQSMNINVFLLFFSFVFLQIERERVEGYTKFGIKRNSPKGTYLISLMEFGGESFFFYGLIDFMLFLILAWRKWLLKSEIFLCLLLLVLAPSATSPVQQLTFFFSISADGRESPLPF